MKNIVLIGAPASGKGTLSEILIKNYGIPHISTGQVLNETIEKKDSNSELLQEYMKKGLLVPDDIVTKIIKTRLENDDCKNGYILDGFPRTLKQAELLDSITKGTDRKIDFIIIISVDESILKQRIIFRRVCKKCGASYNLISLKPKITNICDKCGSFLYARPDDNEKTFSNRLKIYNSNLKQLIKFYENKDVLIVNINGSSGLKEIEKNIKRIIN